MTESAPALNPTTAPVLNPTAAPALKEQRSLFGEILDWMLAPLLLLWPMSVILTWLVAQGIANKPFDRELGEMVRILAKQVVVQVVVQGVVQGVVHDARSSSASNNPVGEAVATFVLPAAASEILHTDEADSIYYQVLGLRGEFLSGERAVPVPVDEERSVSGISGTSGTSGEVQFRDDVVNNDAVRVAYLWVDTPGRPGNAAPLIQVAETLGKRSRLVSEIIKGVILPQFVILPMAVLLVWLALARGIAPLNELQRRIRGRDSSDLSPIDEREAPEEVSPLVRAINDLLARLDQSLKAQKHFLADAAHQLKTPLAGLRTQAELAEREIDSGIETGISDPQAVKRSLQQISLSSQRAAHMVNQLLAMARAEDPQHAAHKQAVNLTRLAREAVQDFVPRALEKQIDLGLEGSELNPPLLIQGNATLLRELIRNLVDNALLYTPSGGTVTVRVLDDPFGQVVVLQVEDSGPGIAPLEREQVFLPFYRVLGTNVDGSGLGLAIVREIAQQHGAEVAVEDAGIKPKTAAADTRQADASHGPGTRFTLRFTVTPTT